MLSRQGQQKTPNLCIYCAAFTSLWQATRLVYVPNTLVFLTLLQMLCHVTTCLPFIYAPHRLPRSHHLFSLNCWTCSCGSAPTGHQPARGKCFLLPWTGISTINTDYRSGQKQFLQFCHDSALQPWPLTEHLFCLFVGKENLCHQTIKCYLSAQVLSLHCALPQHYHRTR